MNISSIQQLCNDGFESMNHRETKVQFREMKSIKTLSQKLSTEKLRFMDDALLGDISIAIEDRNTQRKLRRIIEKRVCQDWWKSKKHEKYSNFPRSVTKKWVTNQFKNIYHYIPEGFHYCA